MSEWANLNGDSITLCINSQREKKNCYGQMAGSVVKRRMLREGLKKKTFDDDDDDLL